MNDEVFAKYFLFLLFEISWNNESLDVLFIYLSQFCRTPIVSNSFVNLRTFVQVNDEIFITNSFSSIGRSVIKLEINSTLFA